MKSFSLIAALCLTANAHASQADVAAQMALAANDLLNSLDDQQKKIVQFELQDDERQNWHFIPKERNGLTLKQMQPQQQQLGYASSLLKSVATKFHAVLTPCPPSL